MGIEYIVKVEQDVNRYDVLSLCNRIVRDYLRSMKEIGEHVFITDVYKLVNAVRGVIDTIDVQITNKTGSEYSDTYLDIGLNTSSDGTKLFIPNDCIAEFKYPSTDIKGSVK